MLLRPILLLGIASTVSFASLVAEEEASMTMMGASAKLDPKQVEFFEQKVQPILKEACYKCHSVEANKAKGDLTMDSREGILKGGKNGAIIKPGDPSKSALITAVSYTDPDLQMPPKGEKLTKQQVADLTEWVEMGAPDNRKSQPSISSKLSGLTDKARSHWAYQPVKKPAIPAVKNRAWCLTPVDAFIMQKLEEKSMAPSPLADKDTLLRRVTYDLIGLPPTPKEVDAFESDGSPNAYEKVVDRLLASRHYGERWGRFWLDTARYADTIGGDRGDNMGQDYRYPYAWTYRDWVINAMNADMPYDQFVTQQLAADKIPSNSKENLAALGFLTVGERFGNDNDVINDRIDVVSKGFLAMTVACARCHDHMFDPIPTKDYYALHGVFASITEPSEKPLMASPEKEALRADFEKKLAEFEQENRGQYYQVVSDANANFRSKAAAYLIANYKNRGNASAENLLAANKLIKDEKLDGELVRDIGRRIRREDAVFGPISRFFDGGDSWKEIAKVVAQNKGGRYNPVVAAAFSGTTPQTFEDLAQIYGKIFAEVDAKGRDYVKAASQAQAEPVGGFDPSTDQLLNAPFKVEIASRLTTDHLRDAVNGWPQQMRGRGKFVFGKINNHLLTHDGAPRRAMVVADRTNPQDTAVMIRGQAETRGEMVPRRFLEVLSPGGKPTPFKQGSGRLELAQAIGSKSNPLTARVIVNRIWMHHFGEGFVRTPDDLGTQSEAPSHPELLDYLSSYFMDQGWSMKKLHKLILLSKVYQESSYTIPAQEVLDPENRMLWRANVRRLDFESMRDSLLVFSGKLDETFGGQPVNLTDEPYSYRRSVYGYIDRGDIPELMAHFDFSRPDMPNSKRTTTVVPQQALYLMNSPMSADVARSILASPKVADAKENLSRVNAIIRVIFQRSPRPGGQEVQLAFKFLAEEMKQEPQMAEANKALSEKFAKSAKERYEGSLNRTNEGQRAIQNDGKIVERKPLTPWETYAQALLLSNEAAYVN